MKQIYLDHAATSVLHPQALEAMMPYFSTVFGNPSSIHQFGRQAKQALMEARESIASLLSANNNEVLFTSGGTEANNLALIGFARANREKGTHIITSEIEHHAVLHTLEELAKEGFSITKLPVNENGQISLAQLKNALTEETILVSIMFANNEVGTVQPIKEIGELLKGHQAALHSDAVQAAGLYELNTDELGVDLMTIASHKLNGPKGIGCLFVREGIELEPLLHGGEQERKRRAGTENVAGAVGFAQAFNQAYAEREQRRQSYKLYRTMFFETMERRGVAVLENGESGERLDHILNVCFPGASTEPLLMKLDLQGIAASGGSACTAGTLQPSHVIQAMYGKDSHRVKEAIRFSFGITNSKEELAYAFEQIADCVLSEQGKKAFIE
ncbi:iron-sulfur cofactor synthesis [Niallia circulans]|uniref:cysteine desulfurase family protein n=1 Tax=Shouchella clausii TaxID=79880 RepID=UPI000B971E70|nr:cysteine desulfurase family protein [Shouchella clausii]PAD43750.1 cysteine desulfurase NifS [Bacillus sp. 7520-S]SPU21603.1 iron-sulfur cofactor synthesis [Niallia circulans]AST98714.1 cysteine desulfurase NifS [Shouchella clausii]MBU8595262.1 cysteine desulfurase [Shouchella clausii]MCM3549706.1 cysteine desulfurase [Shouchella clausii]